MSSLRPTDQSDAPARFNDWDVDLAPSPAPRGELRSSGADSEVDRIAGQTHDAPRVDENIDIRGENSWGVGRSHATGDSIVPQTLQEVYIETLSFYTLRLTWYEDFT
jgi:hypothetical protein